MSDNSIYSYWDLESSRKLKSSLIVCHNGRSIAHELLGKLFRKNEREGQWKSWFEKNRKNGMRIFMNKFFLKKIFFGIFSEEKCIDKEWKENQSSWMNKKNCNSGLIKFGRAGKNTIKNGVYFGRKFL